MPLFRSVQLIIPWKFASTTSACRTRVWSLSHRNCSGIKLSPNGNRRETRMRVLDLAHHPLAPTHHFHFHRFSVEPPAAMFGPCVRVTRVFARLDVPDVPQNKGNKFTVVFKSPFWPSQKIMVVFKRDFKKCVISSNTFPHVSTSK